MLARTKRIRPFAATLLLALVCSAPATRAEIQTLFRGQAYSESDAAAKLDEFAATYSTADEWQARAKRIRDGVRRGLKLHRLPPPCDLAPVWQARGGGDGYTVSNVAFQSLPGYWVTGNLYAPSKPQAPAPGVLAPHGHLPDGRMHEATQTRCAALARMGAVVFAYDMVGFGESRQVPHKHSETARLQTYNSMRAVDFLLALSQTPFAAQANARFGPSPPGWNAATPDARLVDETRLAVTGESGGGTQSFLLACLDERIDLSAPVVQVSAHFYGGCICESGMPIHKSARHETNNVEIVATFAPKPQLIVSDGQDWTHNMPRVEFPYLRRVYELMGAGDKVENAHFPDEGHDYGPSKRAAMYRFVAKHFGLDLSRVQNDAGEIDESFVTIRTRNELCTFPPGMPLPHGSVVDADEVARLLDGD